MIKDCLRCERFNGPCNHIKNPAMADPVVCKSKMSTIVQAWESAAHNICLFFTGRRGCGPYAVTQEYANSYEGTEEELKLLDALRRCDLDDIRKAIGSRWEVHT